MGSRTLSSRSLLLHFQSPILSGIAPVLRDIVIHKPRASHISSHSFLLLGLDYGGPFPPSLFLMVTPSQHYGLVEAGSLFSCHRSPAHNRDIIKVIAVKRQDLGTELERAYSCTPKAGTLTHLSDSVQVY